MNRSDLLTEAERLITTDRAGTHGDARENFTDLAGIWSTRLGVTVQPWQVPLMLMDLKTVRAGGNPAYADNWLDMIGYAALAGELALSEGRDEVPTEPQPEMPPQTERRPFAGSSWAYLLNRPDLVYDHLTLAPRKVGVLSENDIAAGIKAQMPPPAPEGHRWVRDVDMTGSENIANRKYWSLETGAQRYHSHRLLPARENLWWLFENDGGAT